MKIGIDASRAFISQKTGIEEYSYQTIKHLRNKLNEAQVFLYLRKNQKIDFNLPKNWKIKVINFPYLWTHTGLSLEMLFHPVDVLFIPAHIIPLIYSKNTIVTIHGLEYEFCPKAYSFWARTYMRWAIKRSCKVAKKIIAVSENTKKDLVNLYKVPEEKVEVIYEGATFLKSSSPLGGGCPTEQEREDIFNVQKNEQFSEVPSLIRPSGTFSLREKVVDISKLYLLFIGRLEERKNIRGIIEAYKILKEKYKISHKLVLAGGKGYKYKNIKYKVESIKYKDAIILTGFVSEEEKWELLKNADVFLFPTFYEGFGLPILEAQSVGVPVVASNNSSMLEITNYEINTKYENTKNSFKSAILINPYNPKEIAEATYRLISDNALRDDIIKEGYENVKRFSWDKCAEEIAKLLNC